MYIVFFLDPDGDSYSLHRVVKDAKEVFDARVMEWSRAVNNREQVGWDDYKTLLCHITDMSNFGFGSHGDVFGMEVLDSLNWEGDQE